MTRGFPLPRGLLPKVSSLIKSFFSVKSLLPHLLTEVHPDHLILKLHASRLCPTLPWSTSLFFQGLDHLLTQRTFSSCICCLRWVHPHTPAAAPRAKICHWLFDMPGTQLAIGRSCWMNEWIHGKRTVELACCAFLTVPVTHKMAPAQKEFSRMYISSHCPWSKLSGNCSRE